MASRFSMRKRISRYGFHLEEVAKSCGIDFTHQAPHLDSKLDHIMPQSLRWRGGFGRSISTMTAGTTSTSPQRRRQQNCLYRNLGNGQFKDVAPELGWPI